MRQLFKGDKYSREETVRGNTCKVCKRLWSLKYVHSERSEGSERSEHLSNFKLADI